MSTTVTSSPSTSLSTPTSRTSVSSTSLALPTQPRHPQLASYARPTHPTILLPFDSLLYSLPCLDLHYTVRVHLHTALVTLVAHYHQIAAFTTDGVLAIPLPDQALVKHVAVEVAERATEAEGGHRARLIETALLDAKQAKAVLERLSAEGKMRQELLHATPGSSHALPVGRLPPLSYSEPTPGLFYLPLSALPSASHLSVRCQYEVQLPYTLGCYALTLPMSKVVSDSVSGCETSVSVTLTDMGDDVRYHSPSHELAVSRIGGGEIELHMKQSVPGQSDGAATEKVESSKDFRLTYTYSTDRIQCSAVAQPSLAPTSSQLSSDAAVPIEGGGSLLIHLCPPAVESLTTFFTRHYVFVLDRSCSLAPHRAFHSLVGAVSASLTNLKPADTFSLVVYDTAHTAYTSELIAASPANVAAAVSWLRTQAPPPRRRKGEDGRVDARGAVETAVRMFDGVAGAGDDNAVAYLVLATAGASAVDRTVADWYAAHAQQRAQRGRGRGLRVLTLGIGRWVNMLWLKRLAELGSGVCRWVGESERVYGAMVELVQGCSVPVVVDVRVESNAVLRLCPNAPPDLCLNQPLTLQAAYSGAPPSHITLHGRTADGEWQQTVRVQQPKHSGAPVGWRERLDVICARAWAEADGEAEGEEVCVALSVRNGVPCCYTRMLAYETNRKPAASGEMEQSAAFDVKDVVGDTVLLSAGVFGEGSVEETVKGTSGLTEGNEDVGAGCCGWRDWEWHECLQC